MKNIFFFFFLTLSYYINAQDYFQQEVNHNIEAILDVNSNMVHVTQKLNYHNNSPDVLEKIILHLWSNAIRGIYKISDRGRGRRY